MGLACRQLVGLFLLAPVFALLFFLFRARGQRVVGHALAFARLPGAALTTHLPLRFLDDLPLAVDRRFQFVHEKLEITVSRRGQSGGQAGLEAGGVIFAVLEQQLELLFRILAGSDCLSKPFCGFVGFG